MLLGGMVGGAIAVVGTRSRRASQARRAAEPVAGLEAFEGAPCWQHDRARASAEPERPSVDSAADA
jgi:hypothetical protein